MTRKVFVDGDRWMASDAQLVMDQTRPIFATGAERDAQWPSPPVGSRCYLLDPGVAQVRLAAGWRTEAPRYHVFGSDSSVGTASQWVAVARATITVQGGAARGIFAIAHHGGTSPTPASAGIVSVRVQQQATPPSAPNIDVHWLSRSPGLAADCVAVVVDHGSLPVEATLYVKGYRAYEQVFVQAMLASGWVPLDRQPLAGTSLPAQGTAVIASTGYPMSQAIGGLLTRTAGAAMNIPNVWNIISTGLSPSTRGLVGVEYNKYGAGEVRVESGGLYHVSYAARFNAVLPAGRVILGLGQATNAAPAPTAQPSNVWTQVEVQNASTTNQNLYHQGSALLSLSAGATLAVMAFGQMSTGTSLSVDQVAFSLACIGA